MRHTRGSVGVLVAALMLGTVFPASALAVKRCYNYGTDWRRSPYLGANATESGEKAASGQVLRSADYVASAASGGAYADEAFTKLKTSDTQALSVISHGSGEEMVLIDKPSRSSLLSCINIQNRGPHTHFGTNCDHQRSVKNLSGVGTGAQLVVFQGCGTATVGYLGYPYGLTTATYYNLLPAKSVVGFKTTLSGLLDANRTDVVSRRWSYVFWDYMGRGYSVTYAADKARASVLEYFGGTLGYESYVVAGSTSYVLPQ